MTAGAADAPERFFLRFTDAYLVHEPGGGRPQIATEGNVLSYTPDWEARRLKPFLFHLRQRNWDGFYWKVNTSRQSVYRVRGGNFGGFGGDEQTLDIDVDPVGDANDPQRYFLRLSDAYLVHEPGGGALQIVAAGNVLAYGDRWETRRLKPYLYHLRHRQWQGFYWKVNTSRRNVYRVKGGTFGQLGGRSETLQMGVDVVAAESAGDARETPDASDLPRQRVPDHNARDAIEQAIDQRRQVAVPPTAMFDWGGTWDSSFGELRLHQFDGYVVGDYADNGVMLGKASNDCVAGVFTNGARNGHFRFRARGDDDFEGRWAWHGEPLDGTWNGERASSQSPREYRNFTREGGTTQRHDNERAVYDGSYASQHGRIDLYARDLFLVGNYADKGVIVGMWDGDSYVGRFTNEERTGWMDFEFLSRNGSFRQGRWGWIGDDGGGEWSLKRQSDDAPEIDNMLDGVSCP